MIPFNTQSGASPDTAGQISSMQAVSSEDDSSILDLTGLDLSGDLLFSPTYLLDSWTEVLLKDTSLNSAAAEKQSGVSGTAVSTDIRIVATDGQEEPRTVNSTGSPVTSGLGSEAQVPLAMMPTGFQMDWPDTNETSAVEAVSASSTDATATPLDNDPLEESSKILAEIPSILTAFLDGGQLRDKSFKKLRFSESRPGCTAEECSVVGQRHSGEHGPKVENHVDGVSHLEETCTPEDEVFGTTRETPEVQEPDSDSTVQTNGDSHESTDVFSSQFENILESERLCSVLYNSLDSLEALSSSADDAADVGMPLTPMIQQRLREAAGHFLDHLTSDGGKQEVLSVTATGRSGKAALEVTSSSSSGGLTGRSDGGLGGAVANGVVENPEQRPHEWLSSSDAEVRAALSTDWPSDMDPTNDSSDTLLHGSRGDREGARRLARRLYNLEGFRRSDVAKHLDKDNDFSRMVAKEYLNFFDFTGMSLDHSLRSFLKAFALLGETQERERVLVHFSNRYYHCNPTTISSEDGVHFLTCALMLLNTDLHGHNIGEKITCHEFISNLEGQNGGQDFPAELLKALYNSIKNEKLEWAVDGDERSDQRDGSHVKSISRISSGSNPFLDITHDPNATVYKTGFLARKIQADMDEKKTPRGKRGWKTFYAVLKGMILYLQKDEYKPEKALSNEDLKNAISIHHSLSNKDMEYEKKPNVLKLKTADWRVFLFQAQTQEEMDSWIRVINSVAAKFSAPSFPAAIGSQRKFSRPVLPATTTRMSQEEQMKSHQEKLKHVSMELAEHRSYPPDKKVKFKGIDEYKLKEHYLEFEENRYEMYVKLLRDGLKEVLAGNNGDAVLKKSQSSPSLNQDQVQPATVVRVKRNTSERKDHRPDSPKAT